MNGDFHTISPNGNVTKTQPLGLSNVTSRAVTIGPVILLELILWMHSGSGEAIFWMQVTIAALCFLVIVGCVKQIGNSAIKIVLFMRGGVSPFPGPKTSPDVVLFLI